MIRIYFTSFKIHEQHRPETEPEKKPNGLKTRLRVHGGENISFQKHPRVKIWQEFSRRISHFARFRGGAQIIKPPANSNSKEIAQGQGEGQLSWLGGIWTGARQQLWHFAVFWSYLFGSASARLQICRALSRKNFWFRIITFPRILCLTFYNLYLLCKRFTNE